VTFPIEEYIRESNAIEDVYSDDAAEDSCAAYEYLRQHESLTHQRVKKTHEIILQNRQPDIAGEYRAVNVRVGGDLPPDPADVESRMNSLLADEPETSLDAIEWHIDFEKIHPFRDGNGRVGRLIYVWHCLEQLDVTPIMWREEDKGGYYSLFD